MLDQKNKTNIEDLGISHGNASELSKVHLVGTGGEHYRGQTQSALSPTSLIHGKFKS